MKNKNLKEIKYSDQEIDQKFNEGYNQLYREAFPEADIASASAFGLPEQKVFTAGTGVISVTKIPSKTYTRASENLLRQTIGKKRDPYQASLFDTFLEQNLIGRGEIADKEKLEEIKARQLGFFGKDKELVTNYNNKNKNLLYVGANLDIEERRALRALQKSITERGITEGKIFIKSRAEFSENYGLKKLPTKRGKLEYNGREQERAFNALLRLMKKPFYFEYEVKAFKEKKAKRVKDGIKSTHKRQGFSNLIKQIEKITTGNGQLFGYEIEPSKVLIEDLENRVIKNRAIEDKIKALGKVSPAYEGLKDIIEYQFSFTSYKKIYIEYSLKELAKNLWLDNYIRARKWKLIKETIAEVANFFVREGFIEKWETGTTLDNEEKFIFYKKQEAEEIPEIPEKL